MKLSLKIHIKSHSLSGHGVKAKKLLKYFIMGSVRPPGVDRFDRVYSDRKVQEKKRQQQEIDDEAQEKKMQLEQDNETRRYRSKRRKLDRSIYQEAKK